MLIRWIASCFICLTLTSCTYGGGIEDFGVQKTTWFSFLNGDDIRRTCTPGQADFYRLVYNGNYAQQVRVYEVVGEQAGGASLTAKVQRELSLTHITSDDFLGPWRWITETTPLDANNLARLQAALQRDGFFAPAPRGLWLDSRAFYWLAVGCHEGQIFFHAWGYPSPSFQALTFPGLLFQHDRTGVTVNPPRVLDPSERFLPAHRQASPYHNYDFRIEIGRNGLRSHWAPF